ncbi:hypothetical protein XCR_3748 [Xanthomonas campestris pv. raphani 756C]|nr:hypothetical protein XCR_3748 [Xanthomonas campestris pv. raphani 756C]
MGERWHDAELKQESASSNGTRRLHCASRQRDQLRSRALQRRMVPLM